MKIVIPYTYRATAQGPSGRQSEHSFADQVEIDVPEIDEARAPVVLRHHGWNAQHEKYWGLAESPEFGRWEPAVDDRADIRAYDGKLFEPLRIYGMDERGRWCASHLRQGDEAEARFAFKDLECVRTRTHHDMAGTKLRSPNTKMLLVESNANETRKAVETLAKGLLVVGGRLHRSSAEPVFVVSPAKRTDYGRTEIGLAEMLPADRWRGGPSEQVFRLDEADAFRASAIAAYGDKGAEAAEATIAKMTLVDPGALKADIRDDELEAAARRMITEVARRLHDHPLDVILAFDDLRSLMSPGYEARKEREKNAFPLHETTASTMRALADFYASAYGEDANVVVMARAAVDLYLERGGALAFDPDVEASASAMG